MFTMQRIGILPIYVWPPNLSPQRGGEPVYSGGFDSILTFVGEWRAYIAALILVGAKWFRACTQSTLIIPLTIWLVPNHLIATWYILLT